MFCPRCKNEEFTEEAKFCNICGLDIKIFPRFKGMGNAVVVYKPMGDESCDCLEGFELGDKVIYEKIEGLSKTKTIFYRVRNEAWSYPEKYYETCGERAFRRCFKVINLGGNDMINVESFFGTNSMDEGSFKNIDEALQKLGMVGATKVDAYMKDGEVIVIEHVPVYGDKVDSIEIGRIIEGKQIYVYLPRIEVDGKMCTVHNNDTETISGAYESVDEKMALKVAEEILRELKGN